MKLSKIFFSKVILIFFFSQIFFNIPKSYAAEEIKIIYSIFSRTIKIDSLKTFAKNNKKTKSLKRILQTTGSSDEEISSVLKKNFAIPVSIASKLVYSEIGNVILKRLSIIIHPPRATDEKTSILALRSSLIKGIVIGNGNINLINFFEGYPTKTVILNVNALSKIMNKVESISELLEFFTDSPLNKIKQN